MATKPSSSIPTLDRRIRELCLQAAATRDDAEAEAILVELRSALRDHAAQMQMILARFPVPSERLVEGRASLRSSLQDRGDFPGSSAAKRAEENSRPERVEDQPRKIS